ncbi:ead/Ea22-like family protein [Enterobacter hormaechei]|uniref:ead/Ea22-like family protein n=1 Tax=Enterobacter hormaechei TaxID=158836 RepID=UPI001E5B30F5|nr:ead/Ea22-like family protein [Enterobacter hormaechei]
MSKIDKRALREAAEKASTDNHTQDEWFHYLRCSTPETVLALLDELEAAEKRIAELSHHLQSAHAFIEHTEAFGHEASNGILCCGDAQWNIDESKSALAAAAKGE